MGNPCGQDDDNPSQNGEDIFQACVPSRSEPGAYTCDWDKTVFYATTSTTTLYPPVMAPPTSSVIDFFAGGHANQLLYNEDNQ